jgi:hypothetical protein
MTTVPPPLACVEPEVDPDVDPDVEEDFDPELELLQPLIAMANATTDAHAARMRRAMTTAFCVPWLG